MCICVGVLFLRALCAVAFTVVLIVLFLLGHTRKASRETSQRVRAVLKAWGSVYVGRFLLGLADLGLRQYSIWCLLLV